MTPIPQVQSIDRVRRLVIGQLTGVGGFELSAGEDGLGGNGHFFAYSLSHGVVEDFV